MRTCTFREINRILTEEYVKIKVERDKIENETGPEYVVIKVAMTAMMNNITAIDKIFEDELREGTKK